MMFRRTILVLAVLLPLVATASAHDALVGMWSGVWVKAGDKLPVIVTFGTDGTGFKGSFDSDALQVAEIPFQNIRSDDRHVSFDLVGDQTTTKFDGRVSGNTLRGTFTERGAKGTFLLRRTPTPGKDNIRSQEITFRNGDTMLAGSLLLPPTAGKHPAIIFLHGSGPEGRWANGWLARKFARSGFVSLIYDKRGVGRSTGDWKSADFDTLVKDAAAGIRFLRARPNVSADDIVVYGHSQGGTIAPLVYAKAGGVSALIASAASGMDAAETEFFSVGNSIGISKLSRAEQSDARSYVAALIEAAYHGTGNEALDRLARKFKGRSWYFDPPLTGNYYWRFARAIEAFHPAEAWRHVKCPVLLLYGADDQRVPATASAAAIEATLKESGNSNVTRRIFPDADHGFVLTTNTAGHVWSRHVQFYAETMIDWLSHRMGPGNSVRSRK